MFVRISDDVVINAERIQCIRAESPVPGMPERSVIEYLGPNNVLHVVEIPNARAKSIIDAIFGGAQ